MATDITSKDHELFYITCLLCAELDKFLKEANTYGTPMFYYEHLKRLEYLKNKASKIVFDE